MLGRSQNLDASSMPYEENSEGYGQESEILYDDEDEYYSEAYDQSPAEDITLHQAMNQNREISAVLDVG